MIAKKKQTKRNNFGKNEECFNCEKRGHYTKDFHGSMSNKEKLEESTKETKYAQ